MPLTPWRLLTIARSLSRILLSPHPHPQVLPPLGDIPPEARLNLVIHHLRHHEIGEAYALIKDMEPSTPPEFILKVGRVTTTVCVGQGQYSTLWRMASIMGYFTRLPGWGLEHR